jgi:apolipoprotein N-acyltransferase
MNRIKNTILYFWRFFVQKNGQDSKTSFFMSLGTSIALFLWLVQSLLEGLTLWGFVVPGFNFVAATAMLTTLAALYLVNHKVRAKTGTDEVEIERE